MTETVAGDRLPAVAVTTMLVPATAVPAESAAVMLPLPSVTVAPRVSTPALAPKLTGYPAILTLFVSVTVAVNVTDDPAVPAAALLERVELLVTKIRCAGICAVVPLELLLPLLELLLELLLLVPEPLLDEPAPGSREIPPPPPPPHPTSTKESRAAAQAWAMV